MGLGAPLKLCVTAGIFKEKSALGKIEQRSSKMGFFNCIEKLSINHITGLVDQESIESIDLIDCLYLDR